MSKEVKELLDRLDIVPQSRDRRPRLSAKSQQIKASPSPLKEEMLPNRMLFRDLQADRRGRLSLLCGIALTRGRLWLEIKRGFP